MSLKTTPLHPRFGVEVHDFDLRGVTDESYSQIRALFEEHSALLFRGQDLSDEDHMRFALMFGPIEDRYADEREKGEAFKVPEVSNVQADGSVSGEMDLHTLNLKANMLWHSDSTFLPVPALANILIARTVTESGGQTELATTRAGWADMPADLKDQIKNRGIWHKYAHSRARISPELARLPMFHKWPDQLWRAVWQNPTNGKEALYIASHAFAVEGMDNDEAAILLERLAKFVTQPEYVFSHTWNVGDVLVWDQRAVLHRARPWNYDEPRRLTSLCVSASDADGLEEIRYSA